MFNKYIINGDYFTELSTTTQFEPITKGRNGAVLVNVQDGVIPIVRTTTIYKNPAQKFLPIHHTIIQEISTITGLPLKFNNILSEIYGHTYHTMNYHSDQALDLDSYICIFSCYSTPHTKTLRTLKLKEKATNKLSEIILDHNSCILFSMTDNTNFLHKIILDRPGTDLWLGLTFRWSKTYIRFINGLPYFNGTDSLLRLATEEEKKQFYKLRGEENRSIEYTYPELDYTISESDLLDV